MIADGGRRDPLLAVVRIMLGIAMGLAAVGAAAFAVAIPLIFAWRGKVVAELVGKGAPPEIIWAIAALLAMSMVVAILGFFFLRHLNRMIASVGEGDPFVPVNADRLRAMAWLSLGIQAITVPMAGIGDWAARVTQDWHFRVEFSVSGLLLSLVLFVLARVFREGARMRADLDGTV